MRLTGTALVRCWHFSDMTTCLAKVRYAIISGRRSAVGRSFNPIAASPKSGPTFFDRLMACALGFAGATSSQLLEEVGVLKSLEHLSFGPVVLLHTQKAGIEWKKPTSLWLVEKDFPF
jgi:hypothetical protein